MTDPNAPLDPETAATQREALPLATVDIAGGTAQRVYRCGDAHKGRLCTSRRSVREEQVSTAVLGLIKARLQSPVAIAYLAEQLCRNAKEASSNIDTDKRSIIKGLDTAAQKVGRLVETVTAAADSAAAGPLLKALEKEELVRQRLEEQLHELERRAKENRSPPTKEDLKERAATLIATLDDHLRTNPVEAREQLRTFIRKGKITMKAMEDGAWTADFDFFPTLLLKKPTKCNNPGQTSEVVYNASCAGRI